MKSNLQPDDVGRRTAFIVGAGRSGTTLLYKLLCLHAEVAYISNYDVHAQWAFPGIMPRFVARRTDSKLNAWFDRGNAYWVTRPWIKKLFPMPVEGEPVYDLCGMSPLPPADFWPDAKTRKCLRSRFQRILNATRAQIMISKRTANNRRLRQLESIFPGARYVHLVRDGREVALSLSHVEWWPTHIVWWDGRSATQMEQAGEERLTVCARNWVEEMKALHAGLAQIERERVLEVRYEQLLADPVSQLAAISRFLGLSMTAEFRNAIESLQLTFRPAAWTARWSSGQLARVMQEQEPLLRELGYI